MEAVRGLPESSMHTVHARRRRTSLGALALLAVTVLSACDSLLSSEAGLADEATIQVTGTATVPVLVVTSTNFLWEYDVLDDDYVITLIKADTARVTSLPYSAKKNMKGLDRFLVRLVNPDGGVTVDVGMDVRLDGRLVYSQRATLRDATLQYYTWFSPDTSY